VCVCVCVCVINFVKVCFGSVELKKFKTLASNAVCNAFSHPFFFALLSLAPLPHPSPLFLFILFKWLTLMIFSWGSDGHSCDVGDVVGISQRGL